MNKQIMTVDDSSSIRQMVSFTLSWRYSAPPMGGAELQPAPEGTGAGESTSLPAGCHACQRALAAAREPPGFLELEPFGLHERAGDGRMGPQLAEPCGSSLQLRLPGTSATGARRSPSTKPKARRVSPSDASTVARSSRRKSGSPGWPGWRSQVIFLTSEVTRGPELEAFADVEAHAVAAGEDGPLTSTGVSAMRFLAYVS